MKVQLLVGRCGPGIVQNRGDIIEVGDDEAVRMMEASPPQCVPHVEAAPVETRTKGPARGGKVTKG